MRLLDKIFGRKASGKRSASFADKKTEQAVIIHFDYGIDELKPLLQLEDKLKEVISENDVGEYDGHEIAIDYSDGFLYMYGPNAETLFKAIKPVLEQTEFMKGARVKIRFGPPKDGVKDIEVVIE